MFYSVHIDKRFLTANVDNAESTTPSILKGIGTHIGHNVRIVLWRFCHWGHEIFRRLNHKFIFLQFREYVR